MTPEIKAVLRKEGLAVEVKAETAEAIALTSAIILSVAKDAGLEVKEVLAVLEEGINTLLTLNEDAASMEDELEVVTASAVAWLEAHEYLHDKVIVISKDNVSLVGKKGGK